MIKFFRRIRYDLMSKNTTSAKNPAGSKTGKYFKYAIGEIVLVVIGILIALQINNWNEWAKDRKKEEQILIKIESNIEESIAIWERVAGGMERRNNDWQIVLDAKQNNYTYSDSLHKHFTRANVIGYFWTLKHTTASFEALKTEGFDIIVNDTLRTLIIDVFEQNILRARQEIKEDHSAARNQYGQYWTKNVSGLLDEFNSTNYNALIKDDYYYSILRTINDWRAGHLRRLNERNIPEMKRTLDLIRKELSK